MKTLAQLANEKRIPIPKKKEEVPLHCKVCAFDWFSRVQNPKECPACKSRYWKTGKTPQGKDASSIVPGDMLE